MQHANYHSLIKHQLIVYYGNPRHNPRNLNLAINTSAQIRASNSRGPPIAEFAFRGHTIIPPSSTQQKQQLIMN